MNSDLYCDILVKKLKPGPALATSDYFLFGLLKKELKGERFDSDEDVQKVVQDIFHTLPKSAYKVARTMEMIIERQDTGSPPFERDTFIPHLCRLNSTTLTIYPTIRRTPGRQHRSYPLMKPKHSQAAQARDCPGNGTPLPFHGATMDRKNNQHTQAMRTRSGCLIKPIIEEEVADSESVVKEGAGIAVGLKGVCAPRGHRSLGEKSVWGQRDLRQEEDGGELPPGHLDYPAEWRQSKILAVLKPGKEPTCSANFRPIALLCTTHKLLERIILARLTPILDPEIPVEQAGFRGNRSCCDRVASLTSFIENGFQLGMKSAVVLLDLSSAYDTVWIDGLIYKLTKVLKCKQTLNLLSSLLSPRKFTVYLNSKSSKEYTIYNGLPQGSVLSPLLYNWYTHDIPQTTSKKFIYADDTAILAQAKTFEELEIQLNKDLETLHNYFENWSLRLNPAKSVHCCFHLNNHRAERKLKLFINNSQITHSEHPKYLGIHLDRTLTFKTHLTKLKGKLSSRNNILHKLAGSSWGSDANTLRTSALALIFSTAEYCAPVWEGSCHTKLIDTQLNSTLRIITGVCQPTRIDWLPVLAHISPPELRRKEATKKMYQKLLDSPDLEINPILQSPPKHRLKSRNPIWSRGNQLLSQNFNISEAWTNSWISSDIPNKNLITSPSVKIPGFSLPRREWVLLNRFRTGRGRCAELMKLWGYTKDPNCACNVPQSMSHILDDCPLYKFNGGISNLHSVTPEALNWLKALPLRL
ncbi:hypothetical protein LAZ67_22000478 [Cordylochernes scorpioides]|uniref:Reverse transcriptase domain-containing protein n=1 Tax=Cordylochernes scorpioides TaxID=51811 RepID=A0ABY6LQM9_9ARAC|nr:hypothetical protein LAZ67_22000478 [Cordylochernes scorpioides]